MDGSLDEPSIDGDDDDLGDSPTRILEDPLSCQIYLNPYTSTCAARRAECCRIVCMSDTHGAHATFPWLPPGDVLIHAGDFTKSGELGTIASLDRYFHELLLQGTVRHIVCIAGNHETTFHRDYYHKNWNRFHRQPFDVAQCRSALRHCIYLEDSLCTIESLNIYGSPWTPKFYDWAFNLPANEIDSAWEAIAPPVDILITHGPPYGRCDHTEMGPAGCPHLLRHVQTRIRPRLHVFGHIHEGAGTSFDGGTLFVNASNLDANYRATHPCIVVDVPLDKSLPATLVLPDCPVNDLKQWIQQHGELYPALLLVVTEEANPTTLPSHNELLQETAFEQVCNDLHLHHNEAARRELRRALSHIYADSFAR